MIDLRTIDGIYFVGIGGIGMSALALYYEQEGFLTGGYDRSESTITRELAGKGCFITYEDSLREVPPLFSDVMFRDRVIVVYTPAIPPENHIISFFRKNRYRIYKRSEILGEISSSGDTVAVAGTHGKTTVSTMAAHLLKQSHVDCTAFLGGISKNYGSNLLTGGGRYIVMEADEFDRSFHRLSPLMAVVTSVDADHLDIYGDHESMINAYNEFCSKIRKQGLLFINYRIRDRIEIPAGVSGYTYGSEPEADYRYYGVRRSGNNYIFNIQTPGGVLEDLEFPFPGIVNIENLTAAVALALSCGVTADEIRQAVTGFMGVRRRFDIRVDLPGLAYIDDYAHHPEEIRACITNVREYFAGRKITGIFQPHLFSRTRDHADGFAAILDELDETILLPVYPAREKPIPGVDSEMIFSRMKSPARKMMVPGDIPGILDPDLIDVLVTIGAGDIDKLVAPIEEKLLNSRMK
ncbi:MAG: UDP-N-acetylmuramate--L-alanine ligase [Bacteroidales bacterium]|jgi:UDP-N-acetylmuramate--alanine ligase|nr:UDP-N-acetylmuramate--L-alanine ligase [Bacteroidales bacterium]